ncbi:hypothetical protein [Psychromonas sp. MME1]|uniref:hypothetical protein n=1 Tax=Psychromonas sp. MME1 TaxID=3231032 RepID=UPI0034E2D705
MLDAICNFDPDNIKIYSIFEFKRLPESEVDKLRYHLLCPVCQQRAYFRRASKDGKQACFGSRYHHQDCSEFNPSSTKTEEERTVTEVEEIVHQSDALLIDFSKVMTAKKSIKASDSDSQDTIATIKKQSALTRGGAVKPDDADIKAQPLLAKQGLAALLTTLLRGSSLASSDLWIYTSATHKWRAKNLFVNVADAKPTENGAPRMYWGTLSHADKELLWFNPAEEVNTGIPIAKYQQKLFSRFNIECGADIEGAGFIMFAKCIASRDKKRQYLQLWDNDLQYIHLSKAK